MDRQITVDTNGKKPRRQIWKTLNNVLCMRKIYKYFLYVLATAVIISTNLSDKPYLGTRTQPTHNLWLFTPMSVAVSFKKRRALHKKRENSHWSFCCIKINNRADQQETHFLISSASTGGQRRKVENTENTRRKKKMNSSGTQQRIWKNSKSCWF